jgi:hypothetical protein
LALVLTMSASGLAGMGLSDHRWKELRAHAVFLGVFRDYRGPRAAFFVEDNTGTLLGPLDLDAPSGPGWALPPGAAPALTAGDHVELVYAAIVDAQRPFGHPPGDKLPRADRTAADPTDGMFVSAVKQGDKRPIVTQDALAQVLAGQKPAGDRRRAAVGALIAGKPVDAPEDLARLSAVVSGGLRALAGGPYAPIARLWSAGKIAEARALVKKLDGFYLGHDRWKRPVQPMESSPGEPLQGPFLRFQEWGDADPLALSYLAPDFVKFLVAERKWQDPPF